MAITLTADTLSKTKFYLRDVLSNTLTDPSSRGTQWIFAGNPSKKEFDTAKYPIIVINEVENSIKKIVLDNSKHSPPTLRYEILLWTTGTHALRDRDTEADEIITAFKTPTSTDGTTTIQNSRLYFKRATMHDEDMYQGTIPDIIRTKVIEVEFIFGS